jgi:HEAT repeat protein
MMSQKFLAILCAVYLALTACSRREPAIEPKSEPPVAETAQVPASASPTSAPLSSPPPVSTPAPMNSRLRDLVESYLVSDGHGGWRKDEKTTTELEKLTADETSQIRQLLTAPQASVRRGAALFLVGQFDESDSRQVEAFTALLADSDAFVRARGLDAARQFGSADKIAALPKIAALLDAQRDDRAENRAAAARLIGGMKKDAHGATPEMEKAAASDADAKVRSAAATAVAQIADTPEVVRVLKKVLTDKDPSVRLVAAARLRQLNRDAAPAAAELAAALADTEKNIAEAAAEALIRIGSPAVEPLAEQLAATSLPARKLALACLVKLGPVAKPAASRIQKCKQDADPEVRQLAEVALKSLGSP